MIARFVALSVAAHTGAVLMVGNLSHAPAPPMLPVTLQLSIATDAPAATDAPGPEAAQTPAAIDTTPLPRDHDAAADTRVADPIATAPEPEAAEAAATPEPPDGQKALPGPAAEPVPTTRTATAVAADPAAESTPSGGSTAAPAAAAPEPVVTAAYPPPPSPATAAIRPADAVPDAPPALVAANAPARPDTSTTSIVNHARSELAALLTSRFVYPQLARTRGWEGRVELEVALRADGTIAAVQIVRSSGHGVLDRDAVRTLERIGVVPGAIQWLNGRDVAVSLPVIYRLVEG